MIIAVSGGRKKVSMGLDGEFPVKAGIGAILLRTEHSDVLSALQNMGKSYGHLCFGCCVSDSNPRNIRRSFLPRRYTALLDHEQ